MKFLTMLSIFSVFFISNLHAQSGDLKEMFDSAKPVFGGTSCQEISASLDTSEISSKGILNVLTPSLEIVKSKKMERATCILAVPLAVPAGKSLVIKSFEENGLASSASRKGSVRLSSSFFFAGGSGPILRSDFKGKFSKDILMTAQNVVLESGCGQSIIFRLQKSAVALNASAKLAKSSIKLELVNCKE